MTIWKRTWLMALAAGLSALLAAASRAEVLFSYDATTGQLPTDQGWLGFDIDSTGPLTDPNVQGTSAANANTVIELVDGMNVLHIRDTLTDSAADLPVFYYPWNSSEQQALIDNGLKFTMVFQGFPTTSGGKGNVRFGFNNTEFELQNANIGSDQTVEVLGLSAELAPNDGQFHTLEIFGQKNGLNYEFSYSFDGGAPTPLNIITNPSPAAIESSVYFGASSSAGRGTDILVKSVTMETLGVVQDQVATIVRTTGSPYGSLAITNNAAPITIVGYSVLSAAGALAPSQWTSIDSAYDLSGNGSVDPNDEWITLTAANVRDNLSEFEPDGDGATLATGQTINLGNVWIQNPVEDVIVELLLNDGSVITLDGKYSGNGGAPFEYGDLDFDGDFDAADFTGVFVPNYGANTAGKSPAERYQTGDFNSDDVVDIFDFLIYNDAYKAANPAAIPLDGSLLAVPEPATASLLLVAAAACLYCRGSSRRRMSLGTITAGAMMIAGISASSVHAATRLAHWKLDEPAGATTAADAVGAHAAVKNGNVSAGAAGIIGNAWQFTGNASDYLQITTAPTGDVLLNLNETFSITGWVKASGTGLATMFSISDDTEPSEEVLFRAAGDEGAAGFGSADLVGRPGIQPGQATSTTKINDNQWHFLAFTQNSAGWSLYVDGVEEDSGVAADGLAMPAAIGANVAHIGVNKDNGGTQWALNGLIDDVVVWNDRLTTSEVRNLHLAGLNGFDAATPFTATLALDVNTVTGNVTLKNVSGVNFEIDAYRIRSAGGSLTPGTWSTLDAQSFDGNVWTRLGNSINEASEGALGESTVLPSGATSINLGALFDETKNIHDLVFDYHVVGTDPSVLYTGTVNYVTGGGFNADFDNDADVDGNDFLIWQRGFGVGTTKSQGDANNSGSVNAADLAIWKSELGSASAALAAHAVPEPATFALVAAAFALLAGRTRRRCRTRMFGLTALAVIAGSMLAAGTARADVFIDRSYLLGDDGAEGASLGATLGSGNGFGTTFDSANAPGSGDLQDLVVVGNPTYVSVAGRPGAAGGSLGASFDGVDDYLKTPFNLAVPSEVWDNPNYFTNYPLNFEGINVQGVQMWVRPDGSKQNVRQDIVKNSGEHGISITANNTWGLVVDVPEPIDSGVPVAFNQWSHVMHVSGINNLADGASISGGALFVNGVIVKAKIATYEFHENQPFTLGAQQLEGDLDGATPTAPEFFYKGVIDDVKVFLWGVNTSNADFGAFNAGEDNDWIAAQLAGIPQGDINRDGVVSGNGTGPAASDDVSALIQNWRYRRVIDGVQLGDWESRIKGDLNFDGVVDLRDAYLVRDGLKASGLGVLNFDLLAAAVPEPSSAALFAIAAIMAARRRRPRD